jgi:hypothetical protein
MEDTMTAIEMTGVIDEDSRLQLDDALPIGGPVRVRVIVLWPSNGDSNDKEWLQAAARNPAFASLGESEEDIYRLGDGKPFDDEA